MPEQLGSPSRSGLFSRDTAPVPLEGVSIDAEISSFCARVAVSQRYVNRESQPIEAVYVFPLDEGAAVCGFEAVIDGTLVVGEVKEREDAFRMYDDAMVRGDGAYLLDEERPDVFQASVGNLPPGKEVLLRLTYVTELAVAGNGLRFTIPTTVSPRYAPVEDQRGVGRPDAQTLNPPVSWTVPYGLNLSVRLEMGGAITRVESPSHPVSVTVNGHSSTVALSQRDAALDRDFVLSVESEGLDKPQAWIEKDDSGRHAVALAFVPTFKHSTSPADVTFLVDRSGSMQGTSIHEVRNALQLCLRSLSSGCTFNVVGFGSTYESLFPQNRAYDDASLGEGTSHVAALQANLGGTEILPALQFVLEQPCLEGRIRQAVILTDGQVSNTDAVLALVSKHAAHNRVFALGIGAGASQHLVNGIARAGGGSAEFIHPGERIEPKVVRLLGRLLSPALTDVAVSWGGLDARQAPARIPPVFSGGRLLVYAFFSEVSRSLLPARGELSAVTPSGSVRFDVLLDPSRIADGKIIATLAARARIRELEESPEWTTARGSRQQDRKATGVSKEIIELSTRYGVISRETSFVAIERRETPELGDTQLRRVPIALTAGWGGLDTMAMGRLAGRDGRVGAPASAGALLLGAPAIGRPSGADEDTDQGRFVRRLMTDAPTAGMPKPGAMGRILERLSGVGRGSRLSNGGASSPLRPTTAGPHAAMVALVALQRADGSWDLSADVAAAVGHELASLESLLSGAIGKDADIRKAWATALALAWLDDHAGEFAGEWTMAAEKARRWLDAVNARPADGGSWSSAAARLLTTTSPPRR